MNFFDHWWRMDYDWWKEKDLQGFMKRKYWEIENCPIQVSMVPDVILSLPTSFSSKIGLVGRVIHIFFDEDIFGCIIC